MLKTLAAVILFTISAFSQNEMIMGSQQYSVTFPDGWDAAYDPDHPSGIFARSQDQQIDMLVYELPATLEDVKMTTGNDLSFNYARIDNYEEVEDVLNGMPVTVIMADAYPQDSDAGVGVLIVLFHISDEMIIKVACELKPEVTEGAYREMEEIISSIKKL